jgi:Holliday junction resolvase
MKKKSITARERDIERHLKDMVQKLGGWCPKWVSPGNMGVPDRICFFPNGLIVFVEVKAPGKKPTKLQKMQINRLRNFKQETIVVDSKEMVNNFIGAVIDLHINKGGAK